MDNRIISVSSGLCEGGRGFGTREASMLGRRLSGKFPCISLGCDGFKLPAELRAGGAEGADSYGIGKRSHFFLSMISSSKRLIHI